MPRKVNYGVDYDDDDGFDDYDEYEYGYEEEEIGEWIFPPSCEILDLQWDAC